MLYPLRNRPNNNLRILIQNLVLNLVLSIVYWFGSILIRITKYKIFTSRSLLVLNERFAQRREDPRENGRDGDGHLAVGGDINFIPPSPHPRFFCMY